MPKVCSGTKRLCSEKTKTLQWSTKPCSEKKKVCSEKGVSLQTFFFHCKVTLLWWWSLSNFWGTPPWLSAKFDFGKIEGGVPPPASTAKCHQNYKFNKFEKLIQNQDLGLRKSGFHYIIWFIPKFFSSCCCLCVLRCFGLFFPNPSSGLGFGLGFEALG